MSSSEDEIEEELRRGLGHNISHQRKRRRRDIDGKELGMLGDFAKDSNRSNLRYMPIAFAGSGSKNTEHSLKNSEASPSEEKETTKMASMNGSRNLFTGLGSDNAIGTTQSKDHSDEEIGDAQPSFGSMNSSINRFNNLDNHKSVSPRNTWMSFQPTTSYPSAPPLNASPFSSKISKSSNPHGSKSSSAGPQSTYGIGAKLMQKMGYVSGKGLGTDGKGILNPIEHKLRPQGLGLGGIKEKTAQAKAEARRQGQDISDDSDDDNITSKRKSKEKGVFGTSQAREKAQRKAKDIYKTIHDMESEGLHVPTGFKSIINMTQSGQGAFISVETLKKGSTTPSSENEESVDFQNTLDKARQEINKYAKEWRALQSRKSYAEFETSQINNKMDSITTEITTLEGILSSLTDLLSTQSNTPNLQLDKVTDVLEKLQFQYLREIKTLQLDEVAVAALTEPLTHEITTWNPLVEPTRFRDEFVRLKLILDIGTDKSDASIDENDDSRKKPAYSYYDSLMYHIWLPKIREAFREHWKYTQPASAILLIENWSNLLPKFILEDLLNTVVNSGLKPHIRHWKPASMMSSNKSHEISPPPHTWLFPWLPYLHTYIPEICDDIKLRFSHLLRGWRITDGAPLEGILEWKEILGEAETETLLVKNLLPRLSQLLRRELDFSFDLSSSTEKHNGLREILKWHVAFKPSTFGVLLETGVFPKWEAATYKILTGPKEPDLVELSEWYEEWHDAIPPEVREIPVVSSELHNCFKIIEDAV